MGEYADGNNMLLDYVSIGFVSYDVQELMEYLFYDNKSTFGIIDSFLSSYSKVLTNDYINFHYEDNKNKGLIYLDIKGQGCRYLENQPNHTWKEFFIKLSQVGEHTSVSEYSVKRIDIAVDSFKKDTLTPKRVSNAISAGLLTCRWQTGKEVNEVQLGSGKLSGQSYYLGKRESEKSLLVYDKKLETGRTDIDYWFRVELRFRKSSANQMMMAILEEDNLTEVIVKLLRQYVQFRSKNHAIKEIRRRKLASWYETYLLYVSCQTLRKLDDRSTENNN